MVFQQNQWLHASFHWQTRVFLDLNFYKSFKIDALIPPVYQIVLSTNMHILLGKILFEEKHQLGRLLTHNLHCYYFNHWFSLLSTYYKFNCNCSWYSSCDPVLTSDNTQSSEHCELFYAILGVDIFQSKFCEISLCNQC